MAFPKPYAESTLKRLYSKLALPRETVDLLHSYFDAMANLYGVIKLSKAYSIIKKQNKNLISEEKFTEFSNIVRRENQNYLILGLEDLYSDATTEKDIEREIIHESLICIDFDDYYYTVDRQVDKPFYIPPKKELLKYADHFYHEETRYTKAMYSFIKNELTYRDGRNPDDETTEDLLFDLITMLLMPEYTPTGIIDRFFKELTREKLEFDSEKRVKRFMEIYNDLHNNTRMAINRGHTPFEIASMTNPKDRMPTSLNFGPNIRKKLQDGEWDVNELRREIMEMDFPSEELRISMLRNLADIDKGNVVSISAGKGKTQKPGRNDLCPCGSGKKYKNCCGNLN